MWNLLCLFPLGSMIYSDFRRRRIGLRDLLAFGILQGGMSLYDWGWETVLLRLCSNFLLFLGLGIGIAGYYRIRYGYVTDMLKKQVGSGDVWFCLTLFPVFSWKELTFFLTFSSGVIVGGWFLYMCLKGNAFTIPLVSGLGCMYIIWMLIRFMYE